MTREMFTPGKTTPQLTPAALFDKQAKIDRIRLEVYNRLLDAAHRKIKMVAGLHNSTQMTYYEVPEWQPGYPRYDVKDCILYIVWNLRHSGFLVLYVPHNRLLISWKEQTDHYYLEESPIRQAMVAVADAAAAAARKDEPPAKPEKKRTGTYRPLADGVVGALADGGSGSGSGRERVTKNITFI